MDDRKVGEPGLAKKAAAKFRVYQNSVGATDAFSNGTHKNKKA